MNDTKTCPSCGFPLEEHQQICPNCLRPTGFIAGKDETEILSEDSPDNRSQHSDDVVAEPMADVVTPPYQPEGDRGKALRSWLWLLLAFMALLMAGGLAWYFISQDNDKHDTYDPVAWQAPAGDRDRDGDQEGLGDIIEEADDDELDDDDDDLFDDDDDDDAVNEPAEGYLKGSIGPYPITMRLEVKSGQRISGWLYYDKNGPSNKLSISGSYDDDGEVTLYERDGDKTTGRFEGRFVTDKILAGQFYAYGSGKQYDFNLTEQ